LTFVFLAILVMAWTIVFLPAVMRASKETPLRSAEHFARGMQVIAPGYDPDHRAEVVQRVSQEPAPRPRRVATSRRPTRRAPARSRSAAIAARKRLQRQALGVLLTFAAWSGIIALFLGGVYWELHLALDASIGLYAVYLVEERRRAAERVAKVRSIHRRPVRRVPPMQAARPGDIRLFDGWAAVEEA
jgi:hypothetical protein